MKHLKSQNNAFEIQNKEIKMIMKQNADGICWENKTIIELNFDSLYTRDNNHNNEFFLFVLLI